MPFHLMKYDLIYLFQYFSGLMIKRLLNLKQREMAAYAIRQMAYDERH